MENWNGQKGFSIVRVKKKQWHFTREWPHILNVQDKNNIIMSKDKLNGKNRFIDKDIMLRQWGDKWKEWEMVNEEQKMGIQWNAKVKIDEFKGLGRK